MTIAATPAGSGTLKTENRGERMEESKLLYLEIGRELELPSYGIALTAEKHPVNKKRVTIRIRQIPPRKPRVKVKRLTRQPKAG